MNEPVAADDRGYLLMCEDCDFLRHEADENGISAVCTDYEGDECPVLEG